MSNWLWVPLIVLFASSILLIAWPDKWDNATVLRICRDGTPIVQLPDGTVWARRGGFTRYRVKSDPAEVCR
jgi:hypothetical protein